MERKKAETLLDQLEQRLQEKDGKGLPASQRAVLYACLCDANPPYKAMPDTLEDAGYGHYNWKTLKTDGYTVFKRLSNAFGEDIKKKNCLRKLVDWNKSLQPESGVIQPSSRATSSPITSSSQLSALSQISSPASSSHLQSPRDLLLFSSWQSVLVELPQAIRRGHRVVSITGAAGIGKTYFAHALRDRIQADFEMVVWCQASDVSIVSHLYHQIQASLTTLTPLEYRSASPQNHLQESDDAIPKLLTLFRTRRILVVVDQAEELYRSHHLAGAFKDRSASYELWLNRLLKFPFDGSCLIWVGRESPACFSAQYGVLANLRLRGLPEADAKQLLDARRSTSPSQMSLWLGPSNRNSLTLTVDPHWKDFVAFCGGNPAWLFREATEMGRSHTQDIRQFIAKPSLDAGLKATLRQTLATLSPVESLLLNWLLLKPLSYQDITALNSPNIEPSDWESALTSLHEYRSLVILDSDQRYSLHPPLLRHVLAEDRVKTITHALWEQPSPSTLSILCACPLFQGRASAEQQQWLWNNVVSKVARYFQQGPSKGDRLHGLFRQDQIAQLQPLLMALHQQPQPLQGYGASNLLNLAIALKLPLSEFDMRGLIIRHVDLQRANVYRANFEQCVFEHTLLPLHLKGRLAAAMTSDGTGIAIGDATGSLLYWWWDGAGFRLQAVSQLCPSDDSSAHRSASSGASSGGTVNGPMAIEAVLFQDPHTLIVISHQQVYSWWINDHNHHRSPVLLTHLSAPVSCCTQRTLPGGMSYVAVGLTNGDIVLWDSMGWDRRDRSTTLIAHRTDISHLAISPDGTALVSVCSGNQGLIWDLRPHQPGPSYQEWSLGMNPCFDVGWTPQGRLRAEADPQTIRLRVRRETSPLLGTQPGGGVGMGSVTHDRSANSEKTDIFEQAIAPGTLIRLCFSDNGRYLSGSSIDSKGEGFLFCWDWQTDTLQSIQQTDGYADVLTTCEAGRLLLTAQPNRIQVFNLEQQELLWQMESQGNQERSKENRLREEGIPWEHVDTPPTPINIQGIQGLSDAERKRLQMVADESL